MPCPKILTRRRRASVLRASVCSFLLSTLPSPFHLVDRSALNVPWNVCGT